MAAFDKRRMDNMRIQLYQLISTGNIAVKRKRDLMYRAAYRRGFHYQRRLLINRGNHKAIQTACNEAV